MGGGQRMRIYPEEMRAAVSDIGCLSDEARRMQRLLQRSWHRLDSGWQSYTRVEANGYFRHAMRELTRMEQMSITFKQTGRLIEAADRATVSFFVVKSLSRSDDVDGNTKNAKAPTNMRDLAREVMDLKLLIRANAKAHKGPVI